MSYLLIFLEHLALSYDSSQSFKRSKFWLKNFKPTRRVKSQNPFKNIFLIDSGKASTVLP